MKKTTILIVDDEEGFARLIKMVLEQTGNYQVEVETRSSHALEKALEVKPDLILLDLIMPEKDGAEVHADLKADALLSSIPVLYITSNVCASDTTSGPLVQTGDGLMLPKTSSPETIKQCIEDALAGRL